MLDYKDIIIKHYALHMSGRQIAAAIGASKSGVNDFLKAFEQCESLSYPLPAGITNYGIAELVYGRNPEGADGRDLSFELPDFAEVEKQMNSRKNMTLVFLANSHFPRPAGPHFPASQGHIKRPVLEISRVERVPPC